MPGITWSNPRQALPIARRVMSHSHSLALWFCLCALLVGCGGGTKIAALPAPSPPSPGAPSISVQPSNQTVALGQSAVFTVTAAGSGTLTYQLQENGSAIT